MKSAAKFFFLVVVLSVIATGIYAQINREMVPVNGKKADSSRIIVVLGSSTAAGTGPSSPDSAWVNRFRRYITGLDSNDQVINRAVVGYTTYDIMPNGFKPPAHRHAPNTYHNITYALSLDPSAIIINLPSNDAANGYSVADQLSNYDLILEKADEQNVPVWVTTTQPRNFTSQSLLQLLIDMRDSTFARFGDKAIDFWTGIAAADGTILSKYNSGDGIHINDAGHRIFYERVVATEVRDYYTPADEHGEVLPQRFELKQNYPNPFNPETTIAYTLNNNAIVNLSIYDIRGQEVASLQNGPQSPGKHRVKWNAAGYASGAYFYMLTVKNSENGQSHKAGKMLLLK